MDINDIIRKKKLDKRQTEFVRKIIKIGGEFTNKDFAKHWGTKNFPANFKKILSDDPPLLKLIQSRPQKYALNIDSVKVATLDPKTLEPLTIENKVTPSKDFSIIEKVNLLEKRILKLEKNFKNMVAPFKKIKLKNFKEELYKEYSYLNPSKDISGVDLDNLKRRICMELQISPDYFEDLIYDLNRFEVNIVIQKGRDKRYIQIKSK